MNLLPTPTQIITHLNLYVRGQARAKQDIAVAVYNHYLAQAYRDESGVDLGRYHLLLLGPTGSGKTYIVKTLAKWLDVPVSYASATTLVEAGYKGDSVDTIVQSLLERAGGDPRKAEKGIVFIDEIDKVKRGWTGGRDVSGEGVQNALLTLLDGRIAQGSESNRHAAVDTSKLLFICTGAFVGLRELVETRLGLGRHQIGFVQRPQEDVATMPDGPQYSLLCQAQTGDFVNFGMIPEFIGRFATISALHELSQADMLAILQDVQGSPLAAQQQLARLHGIELGMSSAALAALASEAVRLGTGARGLHRLIGRAVDSVDARWPELAAQGVTRIEIGEECVLGKPENCQPTPHYEPNGLLRSDAALRERALSGLPRRPRAVQPAEADASSTTSKQRQRDNSPFTDVRGLSDEQLWNQINTLKHGTLAWDKTSSSAQTWWKTFEQDNQQRPALILRVLEELQLRRATLGDLFLAFSYSNTDNIQANLHYLDYMKLKQGDGE
jgi:ATP-dependent Clp protease ATP-binding subunit ClpX